MIMHISISENRASTERTLIGLFYSYIRILCHLWSLASLYSLLYSLVDGMVHHFPEFADLLLELTFLLFFQEADL